jgi:hypothetical protein
MCKQCCVSTVSIPGCNLRAHNLDQLTSRQRGKLAVPTLPAPADNLPPFNVSDTTALDAMTGHDPVVIFLEQEKQRAKAERSQNLRTLQLEDDWEEQYQDAIAASLAVSRTTPHLANPASSSRISSESFVLSAPLPSLLPLASPSGFSMPPTAPHSRLLTKPTTTVRTIPYRPPTSKPGIKEHMSEDWMRPVVDNTKKPKRRNRINLDNTFYLIFWHTVLLQFDFRVMYTKFFHRTESHRNGEPFMSVHFGQSGSCWTLSMSVRSLIFKPSF